MRRLLLIIALIAPMLLLGGWLAAEQWPIWAAPSPSWLPAGAPGVCDAVASLRVFNAARVSDPAAVTPLEARKRADRLTQHQYNLDALPTYAEPVLVRGDFPNVGRRLAWLYTAALPGEVARPKAVVIYLDAETGGALAVITGSTARESAACTLDPRVLLRRAVRTAPALALAGYTALLVVGIVAGVAVRVVRRRQALTLNRIL